MTIKVAIIGCGRMGKDIASRVLDEQDLELVAAVDAVGTPFAGEDIGVLSTGKPCGVEVRGADKLGEVLEESKPDVVVDFSTANAVPRNTQTVVSHQANLVIGTTGYIKDQLNQIKDSINTSQAGAVISPNMGIGVNVFWKIIQQAAKTLNDFDIEIIETHHRFKKDAPSGTALKTAQLIAESIGADLDENATYGRQGEAPRKKKEIGIHAVRGGDIIGDHTVLFATLGESIEITHRAQSRDAFVNGVLLAVRFIHGKQGIYGMDQVLGLD
ncbi:MAG: 4-hydroxy-tetrahydrodipicolinate reductase [Candidatus Altiarchaeales archaeon]|nr:4-hydroxy-tetrahydrodipicolinate reductase [Candidatus Altiarchaeales archaeon]